MTPAATRARAPPGIRSSLGSKISLTVPANWSRIWHSVFAAPRSMVVCRSWPQACIMPSVSLAKGRPVSSWTGRASISARSATHLPGPFLPWIRATTAVGRGCRISSTPIFSNSERIRAAVRVSCMPVSGWAWISRRMATSSSKIPSTKVRISDI